MKNIDAKEQKLSHLNETVEKIPNEETIQAMEDSDAGIGLIESASIEEMFKKLGI